MYGIDHVISFVKTDIRCSSSTQEQDTIFWIISNHARKHDHQVLHKPVEFTFLGKIAAFSLVVSDCTYISQMETRYQYQPYKKHIGRPLRKSA